MLLRHAVPADIPAIAALEAVCFPPAEAASEASIRDRVMAWGDHFWLLTDDHGRILSFINGPVVKAEHLADEMFADASCHDPNGDWLMIFGVDTDPAYRRQGLASRVMHQVIADARSAHLKGIVLTAKEQLVPWYAGFGYADEGVCASQHGGAVWHEMRLTL